MFEVKFKNPESNNLIELLGIDEESLKEKMELVKSVPAEERVDKELSLKGNLINQVLMICTTNEEVVISLIELGKFFKTLEDQKRIRDIIEMMS